MKSHPEAFYAPSFQDLQNEIEDQHRSILFGRILDMQQAGWSQKEIEVVINEWPADWQKLVA